MNIAIIGVGEYSKIIEELILENAENNIVGYLDDRYIYIDFRDNQFFGPITTADKITKFYNDLKFVIGIENNAIRKSIVQKLGLNHKDYVTLCSKQAIISTSAMIGSGTVVMAGSIVNPNTKVGRHCVISSGAVIDHDNTLGDFIHISLNTALSDTVKIGEGTLVGPGATVNPNITIGEWSEVRTGSVVNDEIEILHRSKVVNPAKVKLNKVTGGI